MIRRILIAALPILALAACGMPEGSEYGDESNGVAVEAQARFAGPSQVKVESPQHMVWAVVQTVSGPRLMLVAGSLGNNGETVSSGQDPIPVRDGPGNPPPDKK